MILYEKRTLSIGEFFGVCPIELEKSRKITLRSCVKSSLFVKMGRQKFEKSKEGDPYAK